MPARKRYKYLPTGIHCMAEIVPEDRTINTTFEGPVFARAGDYLVFDGEDGMDVGVCPGETFDKQFEEVQHGKGKATSR